MGFVIAIGVIWGMAKLVSSKKNPQSIINTTTQIGGKVGSVAAKGLTKTTWEAAKYAGRAVSNQVQAPSIQYGSARFLTKREIKKILHKKHQGLSVNGTQGMSLSQDNSFKHLTLIAPSGAGKTSAYVIPSILLQMQKGSSIVVTDPSGEIFQHTSGYAQSLGYDIKVFDITNTKASYSYNPIEHANSHRDIAYLAKILVESALGRDPQTMFWNDGGSTIIETLIKLLKDYHPNHANLANVRYLLNSFGTDGSNIAPLFTQPNVDRGLFSEFSGFINQETKILQGFLSTAKTALKALTDPEIATLLGSDTLNFRTIRSQPTILYVICRESLIPHFSFLIKVFYSQFFNYCMEGVYPTDLPIYVYMDEFGNLGELNEFHTILTTVRKYGVSVSLILQDIEQLTNIYGSQQASIIMNGGTSSKLFLPGMSQSSCETLCKILGTATIQDTNWLTQRKDVAYGRALLTAQEIRTMKIGTGVLIHGNKLPIQLNMVPYYKNKKLNASTKIPAHVLLFSSQRKPVDYITLSINRPNQTVNHKFPPFNL